MSQQMRGLIKAMVVVLCASAVMAFCAVKLPLVAALLVSLPIFLAAVWYGAKA